MPDENEEVQEEEKQEEVQEEQKEPELSEIEQLAVKIGWNPKHEGGDREPISAEEFILKSKEIQSTQTKQNKGLKREIDNLKRGIGQLQQHNETVYKVQVKALKGKIKELQTRRKEAVEDNDSEAVYAIDSQIKDIRDIPDELAVEPMAPTPPEFEEWVEKNSWYSDNEDMRAYADLQGDLVKNGKRPELEGLPFKKLLGEIERLVKDKFPENFKQPEPKPKAPAVEGAGMKRRETTKSKSKYTYKDLSRDQQDACDFFVKQGVMSEEEYIKQLEIIEENQGRV
jgi:hypothetical protein